MKNIHLLIASVLCLGTTSCFDMNQEPQGEMSTVGAFTTVSEINMYLNMFYQGSVPVMGGGTVNNTAIKTQSNSSTNGIAFGDANSDTYIRMRLIHVWLVKLHLVMLLNWMITRLYET